ncbi:MAG: hypothetical protein WDN06_10735 [Asticcacaulis sp.]
MPDDHRHTHQPKSQANARKPHSRNDRDIESAAGVDVVSDDGEDLLDGRQKHKVAERPRPGSL